MNHIKFTRRAARPIRDFLAGLLLFAAIAGSGVIDVRPASDGWLTSAAHARFYELEPLAAEVEAASGMESRSETLVAGLTSTPGALPQFMALLSLALAFSAVFALNMWFGRHLRQAHASYRRRR